MQEGRKEVSLLCLLSQFPALWFSPFPVWAVRSICSSGHDIMLQCDTTLNTAWSCHIAAEVQDLTGYFTGLERLRERLLQARASLQSSSHNVSLSFILSLSLCHLSWDRRPRQAASWWRLTGTTSKDTNSIRGSRGKTLHVTTYCAYHCT